MSGAARAAVELPPRRDRVEGVMLAALIALACAPLLALLIRVWVRGGLVTGGDGYLVVDPLQYLNWLRQASSHLAVTDLYDLRGYPRDFVHPGVMASAALHRLGLGVVASYYVLTPVAAAAVFCSARAYAHRFLATATARRLAVGIAVFACSPVSALVGWTHLGGPQEKFRFDFVGGELWPGTWLWGYLYTALAVAAVPAALLAYERARTAPAVRPLLLAAAAGVVASWLQPWQGATLLATLLAVEAALALRARAVPSAGALRALLAVGAATALPLAYYWVLSRADPAWALAQQANAFPRWPLYVTVLGLAPLGLPALLAYRRRPEDLGSWALRLWPLAALAVFYAPVGTFPFHAFQGLALPLAVLAVEGVATLPPSRLPAPAVGVALALLVIPGTAYRADQLHAAVVAGRQPFFLTPAEHDALGWMSRARGRGGVLAPVYSGLLVPAYTGRPTWVGAGSWTPDFTARSRAADDLFAGRMSPSEAAALIRRSGARFLYSDCHGRADLGARLGGVVSAAHRFGCATVYEVAHR